jgi:beta-lactamase class D OXA-50
VGKAIIMAYAPPIQHPFPEFTVRSLPAALLLIFLNACVSLAQATEWRDSPEVAKLFEAAGLQGTFVLYDVAAGHFIGLRRERAETRYIPASTFKIANSLVGLSVQAVQDVDEVLPYGGEPQRFKEWERDMGLRTAIRVSNVPVYQELARRIGLERMRTNVHKLGYGNMEVGDVVDRFWLVGPLQISAVEQAQFLARLAQDQLPLPHPVQAQVREIAKLDQGDGWTLFGKTGWADTYEPDVGWWVGWVQRGDRIYSFALNVDMPNDGDAAKRIGLGKDCLKALGALP